MRALDHASSMVIAIDLHQFEVRQIYRRWRNVPKVYLVAKLTSISFVCFAFMSLRYFDFEVIKIDIVDDTLSLIDK